MSKRDALHEHYHISKWLKGLNYKRTSTFLGFALPLYLMIDSPLIVQRMRLAWSLRGCMLLWWLIHLAIAINIECQCLGWLAKMFFFFSITFNIIYHIVSGMIFFDQCGGDKCYFIQSRRARFNNILLVGCLLALFWNSLDLHSGYL